MKITELQNLLKTFNLEQLQRIHALVLSELTSRMTEMALSGGGDEI